MHTRFQVTLLKRQGISCQAPPEVPYNFTRKFEESALSSYNTVTDKLGIHRYQRTPQSLAKDLVYSVEGHCSKYYMALLALCFLI